jgi:hypothetical protein
MHGCSLLDNGTARFRSRQTSVIMPRSLVACKASALLQETDPGKFTVAFEDWRDAVVWAVHLQQNLAVQAWPADLLALPELAPAAAPDGTLIRRGIQPKARRS